MHDEKFWTFTPLVRLKGQGQIFSQVNQVPSPRGRVMSLLSKLQDSLEAVQVSAGEMIVQ